MLLPLGIIQRIAVENMQVCLGELYCMADIGFSFIFCRRTCFIQSSWKMFMETFRELGQLV